MEGLASELLRELKRENKRRFILLVICVALLFASNMAWLIAWNLPSETQEETVETYDLQGEDNANVFYNSEGEVHINEPSDSNKGQEENNLQNSETEKR